MKIIKGFLKLGMALTAMFGSLVALMLLSPKAEDKILAWAERILDKLDRPAKPEPADLDTQADEMAERYIDALSEDDFY
ncbi:hypothetical protein IKF76_01020 [Candidatus Saccharibacteria bacterium]|nr:hypothetical protein [Candidatus Saccharibacteria bacterium]